MAHRLRSRRSNGRFVQATMVSIADKCRSLKLTSDRPDEQTFLRCLYQIFTVGGKVEIVLRNKDRCTYENEGF